MAMGIGTVNLGFHPRTQHKRITLLPLLLKLEAWLDRRASRRALYRMDDHALADIGLSRADVEHVNHQTSWQGELLGPVGPR
jgi:uncharacterized protein YjiS (DUF1127 family)